jgi:hypothetical protein
VVRGAAVTIALVVALSACAGGKSEQRAEPTATSSSSEPVAEVALPCVPGAEPFTGPAADELGAERVMAAYCLLAELAAQQERTSLALPVPEQEARDVNRLRMLLTEQAQRRWPGLLRRRAGASTSEIDGLTLHDVRRVPEGYQRADDGPYVFGTRVGPATAELAGDALRLTFTLDTGLVLEEQGDDTGRHSLLPVTRTGTYVMVPDGDGWLVDDWEATFEHGQVRLVGG